MESTFIPELYVIKNVFGSCGKSMRILFGIQIPSTTFCVLSGHLQCAPCAKVILQGAHFLPSKDGKVPFVQFKQWTFFILPFSSLSTERNNIVTESVYFEVLHGNAC